VGELGSRLSGDIAQLENGLIFALPQICRQGVLLVGGITLIALTSGQLTLAMLCTVPFLIVAAVLFGRKLRRLSKEMQDRLAATGVVVEETLQGIAGVKAFANEGFELGRFQSANTSVLAIAFAAARWRAAFFAAFTVAMFGGIVIVLWFGARLLQSGQITPGELTRFGFYAIFVAGAFAQAAELYSQVQRTVGASTRVREILREPAEITVGLPSTLSAPAAPRLAGRVEFSNVSFRYPSRPSPARASLSSARAGRASPP
jgi:ATP-binding cassette subfamily B protein